VSDQKTLAELAEESGIPARTIRFYIARGLLDAPAKAGRNAFYTPDHLARLEQIKALQAEGKTLSEIAPELHGSMDSGRAVTATSWVQFAIADDLMVMARTDVSPWRARQIRAAVQDLAARLGTDKEREETENE
jgi:DNA-binding transcriptional MerR regulator